MKLRLRSSVTKETIRIDVPPSSTLLELKHRLSQALPASSAVSSSSSADYIRLSLNNKDELQSSSPDDTLPMLGIASGDLIFFTTTPNPQGSSKSPTSSVPGSNFPVDSPEKPDSVKQNEIESNSSSDLQVESSIENEKALESLHPGKREEGEFMEVEWEEKDSSSIEVAAGKSFSIPGFLKKVFTEELRNDDDGSKDHKLLMVAVHAVLLESGFIRFDPILHKKIIGLQSPNQRGTDLCYTLLDIVDDQKSNSYTIPNMKLNLQTLGKLVIIYGSLSSGRSSIHHVELNEGDLVPLLNVAWSHCGLSEEIIPPGKDGLLWTSPEKGIFQFWRTVKDRLALPLLIDMCEVAGLGLPPCFMRLPTELKLSILELLPGVDLGKMSCVSSELNYLISNEELWEKKFVSEFGTWDFSLKIQDWKRKFKLALGLQKSKRVSTEWLRNRRRSSGYTGPFIPPRQPIDIGGYNPLLPPPFGNIHYVDNNILPPSRRGSHVPRCDPR
ncbi:unnamed protein product [Cuscuta epithymum]|uniref:F-box domain-containing protein n=1 Tax=Cuscuta epithymum TaxID=186058 RepID=A0AAV0GAL0_9ASTE|nr:unnamed protein product [Cuscuta epithymum]CAH9144577.1 unnamed protein product [Cuscuta epithymum]